jgi:hypothetical protein
MQKCSLNSSIFFLINLSIFIVFLTWKERPENLTTFWTIGNGRKTVGDFWQPLVKIWWLSGSGPKNSDSIPAIWKWEIQTPKIVYGFKREKLFYEKLEKVFLVSKKCFLCRTKHQKIEKIFFIKIFYVKTNETCMC